MAERALTLREINRTTLARQMLLERTTTSVPDAVGRLVGMQAQLASAPYVGLWSRLAGFERGDLSGAIDRRAVVKVTWVRATLHLVTAADYVEYRRALQPLLSAGWTAIVRGRDAGLDVAALLAAAARYIGEAPRTFEEISAWAAALDPGRDVGPMRYAIRTHLPLVQVPVAGGWGFPARPAFALAESWIGRELSGAGTLEGLLRRYLAAFGPASVADMQAWSGAANLKETVEAMRPGLRVVKGEGRVELFDLPGAELVDADAPAPVRFLPEYDNLLLSHRNRARVVADEHRKRVYLPGLRVRATVLVDGFVAAGWGLEKAKGEATLVVEPFAKLSKKDRAEVAEEGERLARFLEPDAKTYASRFES